ncbi:MAG: ImmA/IrrE family metallo-endopeptidase [Defluviitaleaceae bacterium]|nr:ImmA/IrrE family metallo-endopeptidase [Defluviitaleaceae bacterium]
MAKFDGVKEAKKLYERLFDADRVIWTGQYVTDLEKVLDDLDIGVIRADFSKEFNNIDRIRNNNVSGFLFKNKGKHTIFMNTNTSESAKRQRFTLAHEIGHFCLGHSEDNDTYFRPRDINSSSGKDEYEVSANAFAAELLVPEKLIKNLYEVGQSTKLLSEIFNVSEDVIKHRIKNLELR